MKWKVLLVAGILALALSLGGWSTSEATDQTPALAPPHFHHLHLNSTNPDAAIDFYIKAFPSTSRTTYAGLPALKAGKVYVLFNKVSSPPALQPQTAIWHFGWHVTDERATYARYVAEHIPLLPLYTDDTGKDFVYISSDALPGAGGTLGRTKAQLAEAKAQGLKPTGGPGFAYIAGPDGAMIEYQGNMPVERFNHVHMYQENPFCAQLWYEKHLNAPHQGRGPSHTEADCKVPRSERSWPALEKEGTSRYPTSAVAFDDVGLFWYMNQNDTPLVSTRGHLADHFALSVPDLDPWIAKLRAENVTFLEPVHKFGDTHAIMIEGPSKEAIEILEVK